MRNAQEFNVRIFRGYVIHVPYSPFKIGDEVALHAFPDGGIVVNALGTIVETGSFKQMRLRHPRARIIDRTGCYLIPGFVDCHVHYPQVYMIACYGEQLLDWLNLYTFPEEARYKDPLYAKQAAKVFFDELIKCGTTTANVFGSQFILAMEEAFLEAERRRIRVIMGLNLSDRNIPEALRLTPEKAYTLSRTLAKKWHKRGKALYAVTPRFAPVCTPEMLRVCGRLLAESPDYRLHTHANENSGEVEWMKTKELFPKQSYMEVYRRFGLTGPRSLFAHSIYATPQEVALMARTGCRVAHCTSSNFFLGSGHFPMRRYVEAGIPFGIGTDIAGGTGLSMLKELERAYGCQMILHASDPKLAYRLSGTKLLYLATQAGAETLGLEDVAGSFLSGRAADITVLNPARETYLPERMRNCSTPAEELFVLCIAGASHLVQEVYTEGQIAYRAK
jgi:guanine deaminase